MKATDRVKRAWKLHEELILLGVIAERTERKEVAKKAAEAIEKELEQLEKEMTPEEARVYLSEL